MKSDALGAFLVAAIISTEGLLLDKLMGKGPSKIQELFVFFFTGRASNPKFSQGFAKGTMGGGAVRVGQGPVPPRDGDSAEPPAAAAGFLSLREVVQRKDVSRLLAMPWGDPLPPSPSPYDPYRFEPHTFAPIFLGDSVRRGLPPERPYAIDR